MSEDERIPGLVRFGRTDIYFDPLEIVCVQYINEKVLGDNHENKSGGIRIIYSNVTGAGVGNSANSNVPEFNMKGYIQFHQPQWNVIATREQFIEFLKDLGQAKLEARGVLTQQSREVLGSHTASAARSQSASAPVAPFRPAPTPACRPPLNPSQRNQR